VAISILLKECIHSKTRLPRLNAFGVQAPNDSKIRLAMTERLGSQWKGLPRLNAFGVQARNDRKDDSSLDVVKTLDFVYFKLASPLFPNL